MGCKSRLPISAVRICCAKS